MQKQRQGPVVSELIGRLSLAPPLHNAADLVPYCSTPQTHPPHGHGAQVGYSSLFTGLGGPEGLVRGGGGLARHKSPPICDIPSGCCFFTGPWTVTRSSLRMLRRVAAFCLPLRPVLLLVSFPRSRSPVVGVPGLFWLRWVPFVR